MKTLIPNKYLQSAVQVRDLPTPMPALFYCTKESGNIRGMVRYSDDLKWHMVYGAGGLRQCNYKELDDLIANMEKEGFRVVFDLHVV